MSFFLNKKNSSRPRLKRRFLFPLILILAISFSSGYLFAAFNFYKESGNFYSVNNANGSLISSEIDFNLYWEVWHNLKKDYVDRNKLSEQEMFYGSLRGLASSLKDPYTVFLDPQEIKEFTDDLSGSFEGIGAEIGIRQEMITIIAPLAGRPAEKAGLRAGDKIYAIDGQSTIGLTINEAVRKIRGPKGEEVVLTIIREEEEQPLEISVARDLIIIESVDWEMRDDGLFLIKISNFHDDTMFLFNQAVMEILDKDPQGIILDLRNNPGGYLDTAIDLAGEWIAEGPILAEQMSEGRRNEYFANGRYRLQDIPTTVLVNFGSASASEIIAGALRDYGQAVIIGSQTFGKGSVQNLRNLSDGSALKITVGKWLTPGGDYINDKGIEPDIIVEMTKEDYEKDRDPQLEKAIEILLKDSR